MASGNASDLGVASAMMEISEDCIEQGMHKLYNLTELETLTWLCLKFKETLRNFSSARSSVLMTMGLQIIQVMLFSEELDRMITIQAMLEIRLLTTAMWKIALIDCSHQFKLKLAT